MFRRTLRSGGDDDDGCMDWTGLGIYTYHGVRTARRVDE